jgi:class 3 adenylate cyclase
VDKFMGDSVMAYWGAHEVDEDQADHAFQAATNIALALKKDNEIRVREGKEKLQLRIGIHTGHVVVGNIGGGDRQNYTIIGDAVNVTQRLEQMGKEFIGDDEIIILASATAKALASHRFEFENMGTKSLRGREMPISIFAFNPDLG